MSSFATRRATITAVATLLIAVTVLALAAVTLVLSRAGKLKQTIV